jgi:hypothetical protein
LPGSISTNRSLGTDLVPLRIELDEHDRVRARPHLFVLGPLVDAKDEYVDGTLRDGGLPGEEVAHPPVPRLFVVTG